VELSQEQILNRKIKRMIRRRKLENDALIKILFSIEGEKAWDNLKNHPKHEIESETDINLEEHNDIQIIDP